MARGYDLWRGQTRAQPRKRTGGTSFATCDKKGDGEKSSGGKNNETPRLRRALQSRPRWREKERKKRGERKGKPGERKEALCDWGRNPLESATESEGHEGILARVAQILRRGRTSKEGRSLKWSVPLDRLQSRGKRRARDRSCSAGAARIIRGEDAQKETVRKTGKNKRIRKEGSNSMEKDDVADELTSPRRFGEKRKLG